VAGPGLLAAKWRCAEVRQCHYGAYVYGIGVVGQACGADHKQRRIKETGNPAKPAIGASRMNAGRSNNAVTGSVTWFTQMDVCMMTTWGSDAGQI
jgi:hypothetical protein